MELNHIYYGKNIPILQDFPDNCIDALVCDPPAAISFMGQVWDSDKGGRVPWVAGMAEMMREFLRVMKPGAHGFIWALPRTSHWTMCALEDAGFEIRDVVHHIFAQGMPKGKNIGKASKTSQWEGWHSTLKPAVEYWVLVRKPLAEKTIVQQVLKTGTGAINIDACRIDAKGERLQIGSGKLWSQYRDNTLERAEPQENVTGARWPATVLLTHATECVTERCAEHCPIAVLNEQSGVRTSGKSDGFEGPYKADVYGKYAQNIIRPETIYGDTGGASRYFTTLPYAIPSLHYMPKASPSDRTMQGQVENQHPTAKSTKLMEWLVKLITPPGGIVLDPFCGSGSTLIAAQRLGFQWIGIDEDVAYVEIAHARLATMTKE